MIERADRARVYLDAMVFIFAVEGNPEISKPMVSLLKTLHEHPTVGVTSELTLAEVLAGSEKVPSASIKRAYLNLIVWSGFLDLIPVDRDILYRSADLRFIHKKRYGKKLKLPDAIHVATAIRTKCRYFVSADKGIRMPAAAAHTPIAGIPMKRITPDLDGLAAIREALA